MTIKKRKLIIGAAASVVPMTLINRPVMAATCTPSGFVSAAAGSSLHPNDCVGVMYFFTFDQTHVDIHGNSLAGKYVVIIAEDEAMAVDEIYSIRGDAWGEVYDAQEDVSHLQEVSINEVKTD